MTDNEQRAHDFALKAVDWFLDAQQQSKIITIMGSGIDGRETDLYKVYSIAYWAVMRALNREGGNPFENHDAAK